MTTDHRNVGGVTLVRNLFRPIRIINRTNSRTIWTPTYEDIGHIAKSPSNTPPKNKSPHVHKAHKKIYMPFKKNLLQKITTKKPTLHIRSTSKFNSMNSCTVYCFAFIPVRSRRVNLICTVVLLSST